MMGHTIQPVAQKIRKATLFDAVLQELLPFIPIGKIIFSD